MAKKPPIVWHLDTNDIKDYYYNPADRLTRIRDKMIEFEAGRKQLDEILREIKEICDEYKPEAKDSNKQEDPKQS